MLTLLALAAMMQSYPTPVERDFSVADFKFSNGESLSKLNLHCTTIGEPHRNSAGHVDNAVLIMHGTGGTGHQFLGNGFAGVLFGAGQLLDGAKYFIILPDAIGHGRSSKPSDGLHAHFPAYRYGDIVRAQHQLIFDHLKVDHLRLVMGTSMGGMQTWMWGEMFPTDMDALMPLACAPMEIAGRNRMVRKMAIDSIRTDPEWNNGEYRAQPRGLIGAIYALTIMGSAPLQMLKQAPTRAAADSLLERTIKSRMESTDANDFLYQFESSEDYNPNPDLEKIVAPLTAINSADDFINPPELGTLERDIKRVKQGKYVLLPISDATRGHGTHTLPAIWKKQLEDLLNRSNSK